MRWTWAAAAALLAMVGCADKTNETSTADNKQPAAPAEKIPAEDTSIGGTQTLSGGGERSTDPFELDGGRYAVTYKLDQDCYYSASLSPVEGDGIPESLATGTGPIEGDSNVYDVTGGEYYVEMITGPDPDCPWEITLTPA